MLPYLSAGTGFTAQSWINTNQGFPSQPYGSLLAMDVNGDGKADLVQTWNNNGYLYLLTYLSTGTGFTAQSWINTNQNFPSEPNGSLLTMDVNGDGKKDLVQIWNNKGILYLLSYFPSGKNLAPQGAEINTRISFPQRGLENFSGYPVY